MLRQTRLLYEAFDVQLKQGKNLAPLFNIIFTKLNYYGMGGVWPLTTTNFRRSNYQSHEQAQRCFAESLITYLVHGSNDQPRWGHDFPSPELLAKRQFQFDKALGIFLKKIEAEYAKYPAPQSAKIYPLKNYNIADGTFGLDEPPSPESQDRDQPKPPGPRNGGAEAELLTEEGVPAPAVAGVEVPATNRGRVAKSVRGQAIGGVAPPKGLVGDT